MENAPPLPALAAVRPLLGRLKRLMDSPVGALLGGMVFGAWTITVNWPANHVLALEAGAMHTMLSALGTYGGATLMRALFGLGRSKLGGFLLSAFGSIALTYAVLIGFHTALGTPHLFLTLLPGILPTVGFDLFYSYLLACHAGEAPRATARASGESAHVAA